MKTVLNIVTTLLIILFLGYQFYIESCENKCDTNKEPKCSTEEKSPECKSNTEEIDETVVVSTDSTSNIDSLLDEVQGNLISEGIEIDSGAIEENENSEE